MLDIDIDWLTPAGSYLSNGIDMAELEAQAENLRRYGNVMLLRTDAYEASSTEIREKIKKSCDISCYVPENVVKYILEKKLYAN